MTESVAEFLARGGKIESVPAVEVKGPIVGSKYGRGEAGAKRTAKRAARKDRKAYAAVIAATELFS